MSRLNRPPNTARCVAVVLAIVVLLAGCTTSSPTPAGSVAPPPSSVGTAASRVPVVTPSPTSSATQATAPPATFPVLPTLPPAAERVVVYGNLDCGIDDIKDTRRGQTTVYEGTLVCWHQMSDPRVSGREDSEMTLVLASLPDIEIDKWSYPTGTLRNDGGTWRASGWGSEFWDDKDALRTSGTSYYVGEGGYAGLVYRLLYAQGPETAPYGYLAAGWIEPAE